MDSIRFASDKSEQTGKSRGRLRAEVLPVLTILLVALALLIWVSVAFPSLSPDDRQYYRLARMQAKITERNPRQ
jgi:hypothetical protein